MLLAENEKKKLLSQVSGEQQVEVFKAFACFWLRYYSSEWAACWSSGTGPFCHNNFSRLHKQNTFSLALLRHWCCLGCFIMLSPIVAAVISLRSVAFQNWFKWSSEINITSLSGPGFCEYVTFDLKSNHDFILKYFENCCHSCILSVQCLLLKIALFLDLLFLPWLKQIFYIGVHQFQEAWAGSWQIHTFLALICIGCKWYQNAGETGQSRPHIFYR